VTQVTGLKTNQAGAAGDVVTLYKGATKVTDDMDLNKADKSIVFASTIDDSVQVYDGDNGDSIRVVTAGTKCNCEVYVELLRVK
jgi:hypothetical protein